MLEMMEIAPAVARELLDTGEYNRQRSIRARWVSYLANEMEVGSFKPNTMIEIAETPDGKRYVIDGQHRLSAVVASGKTIPFVVLRSAVSGEEDAARLYYRIDMNIGRGASDQLMALRFVEQYGWTKRQLRKLSPAITLIGSNFMKINQRYFHPDDRERLLHEYASSADLYFETICNCPDEMSAAVERSGTIGVALVTFRYSSERYGMEKIQQFWSGVIFDDGVTAGDARKMANRHLMRTVIGGGGVTVGQRQRAVSTQENARVLAHCFNAWITGRQMAQQPRITNQYAPIMILGSRFDGKQESA